MYNIIDNSSIRINRDVNTNNTCYLYVSEIRYHSLPNLHDLWPADASKIGDKKVMKTNPYPSILHHFFLICGEYSKKGGGSHFYWTTGHLTIKRVGKDCTSLY